jgi:hypothetical protein
MFFSEKKGEFVKTICDLCGENLVRSSPRRKVGYSFVLRQKLHDLPKWVLKLFFRTFLKDVEICLNKSSYSKMD